MHLEGIDEPLEGRGGSFPRPSGHRRERGVDGDVIRAHDRDGSVGPEEPFTDRIEDTFLAGGMPARQGTQAEDGVPHRGGPVRGRGDGPTNFDAKALVLNLQDFKGTRSSEVGPGWSIRPPGTFRGRSSLPPRELPSVSREPHGLNIVGFDGPVTLRMPTDPLSMARTIEWSTSR